MGSDSDLGNLLTQMPFLFNHRRVEHTRNAARGHVLLTAAVGQPRCRIIFLRASSWHHSCARKACWPAAEPVGGAPDPRRPMATPDQHRPPEKSRGDEPNCAREGVALRAHSTRGHRAPTTAGTTLHASSAPPRAADADEMAPTPPQGPEPARDSQNQRPHKKRRRCHHVSPKTEHGAPVAT